MIREFPLAGRLPDPPGARGAPAPLRDAATVLLVRDAAAGIEVFAFRRTSRMAFAPGMLVFPGGGVDPRDGDPAVPWHGPAPGELAAVLGADTAAARALVVAAVRETFEECGVLLAGAPGGPPADVTGAAWEARRRDLVAGNTSLAAVLAGAGLVLRADLLRPWAHWVTPAFERRRYVTRFFLARVPAGQAPRDLHAEGLGGEGERASWLDAGQAVAAHAAGKLPLLPPTLVCLEEVAAASSVAELESAQRRVRPVSPWVHRADGGPGGGPVLRVDLDGVGGGEPGP